jgi:hypothetical protein
MGLDRARRVLRLAVGRLGAPRIDRIIEGI